MLFAELPPVVEDVVTDEVRREEELLDTADVDVMVWLVLREPGAVEVDWLIEEEDDDEALDIGEARDSVSPQYTVPI